MTWLSQQFHQSLNQAGRLDLAQQPFINSILQACLLGWQPTTSISFISKGLPFGFGSHQIHHFI